MRRVRFVRYARPFVSNAAGAVALLAFSLYLLGREVFVAQVLRNMPEPADLSALLRFIEDAFLTTNSAVQILTILAGVAGLWLARECVRLLSPNQSFA